MTNSNPLFDAAPAADVAEQLIPVDADEDLFDAAPMRLSDDSEASEADLIEQAIAVPLSDDEGFDR